MKYVVLSDGKEHEVELSELGNHRYQVSAFGRKLVVSAVPLPDGKLLLHHDHQIYELLFDDAVRVRGVNVEATVLTAREAHQRRLQAQDSQAGSWVIRAPMPGKVVSVLVKPGQQ